MTSTTAAPVSVDSLAADTTVTNRAISRATRLLDGALAQTSRRERRSAQRLGRLLADEAGRDLLLDLTDQVLRIRDRRRAARRLHDLVAGGVPASLGFIDGLGLRMLGLIAPLMPWVAERAVDWRVGGETKGVILPAENRPFSRYVAQRSDAGFRLNINVLGEAILSDAEADARFDMVAARLRRPDVNYVSVKISALCANLDVLAWDDSLNRITERLAELYRIAAAHNSFINLDMEEHRDLDLSVEAFISVLDQPEFHQLRAGIVLQAYMPDSHAALERLCQWANARYANGGAGIKIRLVKGANLAMEQVEAEQHDWPQAPYHTKDDVDASYKLMLHNALSWGTPGAVSLGVASHNLFDVAWALTLRDELNAADRLEIEMLEGMAPAQARVVRDECNSLLLYAPVVEKRDRDASIAYLSRRLDENSGPENFLRALFDLTPDSPAWQRETDRFTRSLRRIHEVPTTTFRVQDRTSEHIQFPTDGSFDNVADTDFTTPANRVWAANILSSARTADPALVDTIAGVNEVISRAISAQQQWAASTWQSRRDLLAVMAETLAAHRGDLLTVMATTTGKTLREGDPEVSEGIDFVTYAGHLTVAHEALAAGENSALTWQPHPVTVVAGPWNFPFAIPVAGLVHAVASGGVAILKPAPEARAVGALIVSLIQQACVQAGVSTDLVQLACTPDTEVGAHLITHDDVSKVILTGSFATAEMFHTWKPTLRLNAEASGKNSLIITAAADMDQAIKDLVKSAFGHAGQKCSAASLAIVEASVFDDPSFASRLADAARSLTTGAALDPATIVGPVIAEPSGALAQALTSLGAEESWLVAPRELAPRTWTPSVRWNTQPDSWFHLTECFGPVLGVMRADDLDHAIDLQNATQYGLTGGLHSLDRGEIDLWLSRVQVGNAYVNRHITGAIVQRQPFGGWKRSSIGAGAKPGGPGYLHNFGTWNCASHDVDAATRSLQSAWDNHFGIDHDPTGLRSERNILRYHPLDGVVVVCDENTPAGHKAIASAAAGLSGTPLIWADDDLVNKLSTLNVERLRLLAPVSDDVLAAAHAAGIAVDDHPMCSVGEIELGHWVKEQAISITRHRHGRLLG
ncbi:MAG: bifunctional proline dehydrogenase/L-glutamate gamma-semialdehyde dehydrogenase [Candidatus Nanopelagicales bacterium]